MIQNRKQAAHVLGEKLTGYKKNSNAVIVAIPHGGVPVGYYLAAELHLPLEVIPCKAIEDVMDGRKSIGCVSLDGVAMPGENLDIPQDYVCHQVASIRHHLKAQNRFYHDERKPLAMTGRIVILVDDRLETESRMLACLRSIRNQAPEKIIAAVPVATFHAAQKVVGEADDFICILMPARVDAAEAFYEYLPPVTDEEVRYFLLKAEARYETETSANIQN
jgi:predicted phosphoribosyltransferase